MRLFAQAHPPTTIRPTSAKAAIHAAAHAAARTQLCRRQPRSRTKAATITSTASSGQAVWARLATAPTARGSPLNIGSQNSALVHWLVVQPTMVQTKA